jgi:hypothetical protein
MSLDLLDVGFNGISTTGVRPLMRALGCHPTIRSFTLSGNSLDTEGARAVASAITTSTALHELYLDHTSIGHAGERLICMGLESSHHLNLHVLTGFRLGLTYTRMGFPPEMETLGNEQVSPTLNIIHHPPQRSSSRPRSSTSGINDLGPVNAVPPLTLLLVLLQHRS